MLVLSRFPDEIVVIGEPPNTVEVMVVDVRGHKVRLGFTAAQPVPIHRKEIFDAIQRERMKAEWAADLDVSKAIEEQKAEKTK